MEKRADTYILTLRSYIQAMDGELEIIAHFPAGSVKITSFSGLDIAPICQFIAQDPAATSIASL